MELASSVALMVLGILSASAAVSLGITIRSTEGAFLSFNIFGFVAICCALGVVEPVIPLG